MNNKLVFWSIFRFLSCELYLACIFLFLFSPIGIWYIEKEHARLKGSIHIAQYLYSYSKVYSQRSFPGKKLKYSFYCYAFFSRLCSVSLEITKSQKWTIILRDQDHWGRSLDLDRDWPIKCRREKVFWNHACQMLDPGKCFDGLKKPEIELKT